VKQNVELETAEKKQINFWENKDLANVVHPETHVSIQNHRY
jgi:hypothetical protein